MEDEDFDSKNQAAAAAAAETWGGDTATDEGNEDSKFGTFLGRLGTGQSEPSKKFTILSLSGRQIGDLNEEAYQATVKFSLYLIDSWPSSQDDKFVVKVNNVDVDLGELTTEDDDDSEKTVTGEESGITWKRTTETQGSNLGFGDANDKEYSCLLYTSPSPRDQRGSRMPSSA